MCSGVVHRSGLCFSSRNSSASLTESPMCSPLTSLFSPTVAVHKIPIGLVRLVASVGGSDMVLKVSLSRLSSDNDRRKRAPNNIGFDRSESCNKNTSENFHITTAIDFPIDISIWNILSQFGLFSRVKVSYLCRATNRILSVSTIPTRAPTSDQRGCTCPDAPTCFLSGVVSRDRPASICSDSVKSACASCRQVRAPLTAHEVVCLAARFGSAACRVRLLPR